MVQQTLALELAWLVAQQVGLWLRVRLAQLAGQLVGLLACWLVGLLACWVGWQVGSLACWLGGPSNPRSQPARGQAFPSDGERSRWAAEEAAGGAEEAGRRAGRAVPMRRTERRIHGQRNNSRQRSRS
eukprot:COSAG02_NODE_22444_length_752_cov_1.555896_1_plen_127_part_01